MSEDFGYLKDEEQSKIGIIAKRALILGAILFSISCFIYVTINAYYFVYHDQNNDVTLIKSPDFPIKIIEEDEGAILVKDVDKTVYENIVGNKKEALEKSQASVVTVPEEAISKTIINNQNQRNIAANNIGNISKTETANNKKPSDSKMIFRDSENNFKTIEQSVSEKSLAKNSIASDQKNAAKNDVKTKKNVSRVQLAAMNSNSAADEYWAKLNSKNPQLFSGLKHFVEQVNLGSKGMFYRLQVGDFRNQVEAEEFCIKFIKTVQKAKSDCIVVE